MNRKRIILLTPPLLLILAGFLNAQHSQQINADNSNPEFTHLTLTASVSKFDFLPFEPIPLTVLLANNTTETITGNSAVEFKKNYVKLTVENEKGEKRKISQLSAEMCKCEPEQDKVIEPGQKFESKEVLFNLHQVFAEPGKYRIRVVMNDTKWKSRIVSSPITINILEPAGDDALVYDAVKDEVMQSPFFFSGLGKDQAYESLALRFPKTLYASYASYFVGLRYFYKHDYIKSQEYLNRALTDGRNIFQQEIIDIKKENDLRLKEKAQSQ